MSALRWIGAVLRPEIVLALLMGLAIGIHWGYQIHRNELRAFVNNHGGRMTIVADPDPSIPPPPAGAVGSPCIPRVRLWQR